MPVILKIVAYFLILFGLAVATNAIPKTFEPLKGLTAIITLCWMVGGVFILLRTAYRFITR